MLFALSQKLCHHRVSDINDSLSSPNGQLHNDNTFFAGVGYCTDSNTVWAVHLEQNRGCSAEFFKDVRVKEKNIMGYLRDTNVSTEN